MLMLFIFITGHQNHHLKCMLLLVYISHFILMMNGIIDIT